MKRTSREFLIAQAVFGRDTADDIGKESIELSPRTELIDFTRVRPQVESAAAFATVIEQCIDTLDPVLVPQYKV